jgi:Mg2+ and Co2+ transporter CorA
MPHHTEQTAPPQPRLDDLLAEAAAATRMLPTIDDCRRLQTQLRRAIGQLADTVRRRQDGLPEHSADWQACERALLGAQAALCGDLGLGLRSAALHVATLGEQAQALADCADVASEA